MLLCTLHLVVTPWPTFRWKFATPAAARIEEKEKPVAQKEKEIAVRCRMVYSIMLHKANQVRSQS